MKKYRCPYCGEECITLSNKCIKAEWKKSIYSMKRGNSCPECNNHFGDYNRYKFEHGIYLSVISFPILLFFCFSFLVNAVFIPIFIMYLFLWVFFLLPLDIALFCAITQYDQEKLKPTKLNPNAQIEIKQQNSKIKNLDILGVKFTQKTNIVKFSEAFTNQLVPVVFYKENKKQKSPLNVTFMKKEFIPPALFHEGAEFTIIDNGQTVAEGVIVKIFGSDQMGL